MLESTVIFRGTHLHIINSIKIALSNKLNGHKLINRKRRKRKNNVIHLNKELQSTIYQ